MPKILHPLNHSLLAITHEFLRWLFFTISVFTDIFQNNFLLQNCPWCSLHVSRCLIYKVHRCRFPCFPYFLRQLAYNTTPPPPCQVVFSPFCGFFIFCFSGGIHIIICCAVRTFFVLLLRLPQPPEFQISSVFRCVPCSLFVVLNKYLQKFFDKYKKIWRFFFKKTVVNSVIF